MNKNTTSVQICKTMQRKTCGNAVKNAISGPAMVALMAALVVMVSAFSPREVAGQTGILLGEVTDAERGAPLEGVRVSLQGTGYATTTDAEGRYILRRVSQGSYNLVATHMGYARLETPVSLSAGEQLEFNVELADDLRAGDEVFVQGRQRGESQALTSQRESAAMKSVISSEQMDRFSDYSVEQALVRMPGVQVDRRGTLNLRGAGPGMHNVTIDGQRIGTAGMGDRSYDLGSISSDVVRQVEVIRVPTPDMDAEGLGGTVNIVTRRPAGEQRHLEARLGGAADTRYFFHTGPGGRASVHYAESPHEDFSLALNVNHQLDNGAWESLGVNYDVADFGNGPVDVIESVSPGLQTNNQSRLGGNLHMTYQPSNRSTYHVQAMLNNNDRSVIRHSSRWSAGGDWISPSETGAEGDLGSYGYDARRQDIKFRQGGVQAGGRHYTDLFDLEYSAGWAQSRVDQQDFLFPFLIGGRNMTIDMDNRNRPVMQVSNLALLNDGTIDRRLINLERIHRVLDDHRDDNYTGRVDLTFPFQLGSLKVGSSALLSNKKGSYTNTNFSVRRLSLFRFRMSDEHDFKVFDQYYIPWLIDTEAARFFFDRNRPEMSKNRSNELIMSDVWNYDALEGIYSGYGMATIALGPVTLLGGARAELTNANYEGRRVEVDNTGQHISTDVVNRDIDYLSLFPHAQVQYAIGERSNVRLAYSRSIARPDFNLLAPFELVNASDSTLFRGNPDLDPMFSDNLDLFFEQYFASGGIFSLGVFQKQLSGYIYLRERNVQVGQGEYAAFDELMAENGTSVPARERMFQNSDETASIYGVEVSWQQHLAFMPGFLSNLSTYVNYTWSHSIYDVSYRDDEVTLPYQSPHVVNAALDYSQGRISTQLSYHWTAASLNGLQQTMQLAPSIHTSQEVYMDSYQDGWTDLSLSMRYRISGNFRVWADVSNLLNVERVQYAHSRDLYPVGTDYRGGRAVNVGIRFTL